MSKGRKTGKTGVLLLALGVGPGCAGGEPGHCSTSGTCEPWVSCVTGFCWLSDRVLGGDVPNDGRPPPPISGGTLMVTRDGFLAVASDPDADRVSIVGISGDTPDCTGCDATPQLLATVELERGDEPGRLVEDAYGRVHVALRRAGAVATIDLASGELLARRSVCGAPRGIAYDEAADVLHVACASGDLVSLSPLSGEITRRIALEVDLRDVVVEPSGLVVSRFKSAELFRLDHEGYVVARILPGGIERSPQNLSDLTTDLLEPAVAWRTVSANTGSVFMLHQYGLAQAIDLGSDDAVTAPPTPYAAQAIGCGGIVEQTVSTLVPGRELQMGMPMPVLALSVDLAASNDGAWLAVAHPGSRGESDKVTIYRSEALPALGSSPVPCASNAGHAIVEGQAVAVAMIPGRSPGAVTESDWLIVQTRDPAALSFYRGFAAARVTLFLGGSVASDVGHDLFHLDSGGGIACAQCHPEGAEDGRVWRFVPQGDRRTQAVHVGLEGTHPFHWDGSLATMADLVNEVFVRRMGAAPPSASDIETLADWLFSLSPPAPITDPSAPAAVRGRALFESAEVGCTECHAGPAVANRSSVDVGVESPGAFQVPSLRGVGYRAPFLHNGCAESLRERFESPCAGGDRHGRTSQLSSAEIGDLTEYLQSL